MNNRRKPAPVMDGRDARTVPGVNDEVLAWLRMGDDDRERYGGPEWVAFDVAELYNAPSSVLEGFEAEIGFPLFLLLHEFPTYGSRATRAALFIARRRAGVQRDGRDERYAEFDPQTMHVKRREDPPDGGAKANGLGKRRGGSAASPPGSKDEPSPTSSTTSAQP